MFFLFFLNLLCLCPLFRAIDDKYSRREEYRGFTQDFKEKEGYKPDVKIEYVDESGRKLTPKEVRAYSYCAIARTNVSLITHKVPIVLSPSRLSDSYPIVSMAKDLER